jgi:hypothetical protein
MRPLSTDEGKGEALAIAQSGDATNVFNLLQDQLGKPHVFQVWYDLDMERFRRLGPVTGKEMSMSRIDFIEQIWSPYCPFLPKGHVLSKNGL